MFLKSIYLKNFKRFKELELDFPGDITVIKGPNEQGKSTLVAAIEAGIFANPASESKEARDLRSWGVNEAPQIRFVFEAEGREYELWKDFEKKELYLLDKADNKKTDAFRGISEFFSRVGGYRNEKLFESISCVKQDNIEEVSSGRKEISKALEGVITSGGSLISASDIIVRAEKRLQEFRKGIGDKLVKTPGVLRSLHDSIARAQKEKQEIEENFSRFQFSVKELESLKVKREEAKQKLQVLKAQYERNKNFFDGAVKKERLDADLKEVSRKVEQARLFGREIADFENRKNLFRVFDRISFEEFQEAKQDFRALIETKRNLERSLQTDIYIKSSRLKTVIFAAGLALGAAGAIGFLGNELFFLAWVAGGLLLILGSFFYFGIKVVQKREVKRALAKLEGEIKEKEELWKRVVKESNSKDLEDVDIKWKEYSRLSVELEKRKDRLEALLLGQSLPELVAKSVDIVNAIAVEDMKISNEERANPPTGEAQRVLERDIKKYEEQAGDLIKEIARKEGAHEHQSVSYERILELEEEEQLRGEELGVAQEREAVYQLIIENLEAARLETIKKLKKELEKFISQYISEITDQRYSKVELGDDLSLHLFSDEKKEFIVPDEALSRGTQDQIYLVARFALLKIFSLANHRPLVILDDPFHSFDAKRKERTRLILEELSKDFQILLLTHSDEYDRWGVVRELT